MAEADVVAGDADAIVDADSIVDADVAVAAEVPVSADMALAVVLVTVAAEADVAADDDADVAVACLTSGCNLMTSPTVTADQAARLKYSSRLTETVPCRR